MREMKDSGVKWIGEIPAQWEVRKIASVVPVVTDFVASGSFADLRDNVKYLDTPDYAMLVRTADLSGTRDNTVYIDKHAYEYLSNSNLFGGEIILSNIGSVGNVFQYTPMYERSSLAPNAIMLNGTECNRYLYYWFLNPIANDELKRIGSHAVQLKFNKTQLKQMAIVYPPIEDQQKIAARLDRKCTQIDALISNAQQQIEKLKAYKQSVITETVTKGLDPDVQMKDSGVEWIGEIPEHWTVAPIRSFFKIKKDIIGHEPDTVLSITQGGIKVKDINENSGQMANSYAHYQIVNIGDFAMNHMDLLTGGVGISEFEGVTSPDYRVFVMRNADMNPRYFLYVFQMYYRNKIFYAFGQGAANLGRWRLPAQNFNTVAVPLSPVEEQNSIVTFLDEKCTQIDKLIALKQQKIEKLQQYKKSLIYEYVTGKKEV